MKKIFAALAVAILSVVIIGCGGGDTKPTKQPTETKPAGGGGK